MKSRMAVCFGVALMALMAVAPAVTAAQMQMGGMANEGAKKLPSPPAKVEVALGGASVSIDYSAPSMRGREIFGGLVPYGKVWRTGANAATTLKTSKDLMIGSLHVPAGTYTLYTLPTAEGWQLIVNKQTGQWGTVYDEAKDLGRTAMTVGKTSAPVETFVMSFAGTSGSKTTLHLKWAGADVSVPVSVM